MISFDSVAVDADQLIYAVGFGCKGEPLNHVLHAAKQSINRIREDTGCPHLDIYLKGEGNFRDFIAVTDPYKGTRPPAKPEYYNETREYLISQFGAVTVDGIEADDMVSILLWDDYKKSGGDKEKCRVIVSSPDKDLNNTPGWHYNPMKRKIAYIDEDTAAKHFYYQMLMGDRVDNIKGLPSITPEYIMYYGLTQAASKGCGKGSAQKIIDYHKEPDEIRKAVLNLYMAYGVYKGWSISKCTDYFWEQGALLWMVRELDDNKDPVTFNLIEEDYEIIKEWREGLSSGEFDWRIETPKEEGVNGRGKAEEAIEKDTPRDGRGVCGEQSPLGSDRVPTEIRSNSPYDNDPNKRIRIVPNGRK